MGVVEQKLKAYIDRRKTERERKIKDVEKEDFLLGQIDEFREKAKQLQGLLASKETKVQQLQQIVDEREGKAKELSDMIEERQDAAERVVSGVAAQIDGMVDKVDARLNELSEMFAERLAENVVNTTEQNDEVRSLIREQNEQLSKTVHELDGQFDAIKNEICEKVHTENVKCYRNMQTLIEETDKKLESIQESLSGLRSVNTMVKVNVITTVLALAGVVFLIVHLMGF